MQVSAERYANFSQDVFGTLVPRDFPTSKIHSSYPLDSIYFQRCFDALLRIEHQFVQEQIRRLKADDVPGAFVEFGVFKGDWIRRLYDMTRRAGLGDREIWGFDSFKGLSRPHPDHDSAYWKEGMYAISRDQVEKRLRTWMRRRIKLIQGYFIDSLRGQDAQRLNAVAFARIDCDIYEPALQCLQFLSSRLSHGSILVFDDWTHDIDHGEGKAFAEWVPSVSQLRFEFLCLGPWDHLYLRVLHRDREAPL